VETARQVGEGDESGYDFDKEQCFEFVLENLKGSSVNYVKK